jgi:hypothetical protein
MRKFLIALGAFAILAAGVGTYVISTMPAYACGGLSCG